MSTDGTCSIEGCDRPRHARGWCKPHYVRWYNSGDPLPRVKATACSVDGCDGRVGKRGMCNAHYLRLRRYGRLDLLPALSETERFWAKVDKTGTCWLWTAYCDKDGYGVFSIAGNTPRRAHRYSYELVVGPIPAGLEIDHLCAVRNCVRPGHLEPVTNAENTRRARQRTAPVAA